MSAPSSRAASKPSISRVSQPVSRTPSASATTDPAAAVPKQEDALPGMVPSRTPSVPQAPKPVSRTSSRTPSIKASISRTGQSRVRMPDLDGTGQAVDQAVDLAKHDPQDAGREVRPSATQSVLQAPRPAPGASPSMFAARRIAPSATDVRDRARGGPDRTTRRASVQSTPVHSSRGSGSYEPVQMIGVEGPPIAYWRPTEPRDLPRILEMASSDVMAFFGEAEDIPAILERSVLSLSQLNVLGEVVACLCLSNWPSCPAVHPSASPEWLNTLYELQLSAASTLLVRLLLWDARYLVTCARLLLYSVFVTLPALDQVVIVVPAKTPPNEVLSRLFDEELAKGFKTAANIQSVLVCPREAFVKPLRVRKAECEDNDDLVYIFDQETYRLRQLYGDFYITELITNPESRKIIVAEEPKRNLKQEWEVRSKAIGVMVLNSDVNLPLLNAHFQLLPFYGLRQPHIRDVLNLPGWIKPRPEMAHVLASADTKQQDEKTSGAGPGEGDEDSQLSTAAPRGRGRVEGLAARAARLKAEALERKRRRWTGPEHYLSEISLTEEERNEPNDPYRLSDVTWINIMADAETSSTGSGSSSADEEGTPFKVRHKKKVHARTGSDMLISTIEFLPEFKGPPNAFLVELFAMHDHFDERLAFDFLVEAFRLFPSLDYCALTVPHAYPSFPLLDHFVRVSPREKRNFHQELYVSHRSAVLGELEVREAEPEDRQEVFHMIRTLKRNLHIVLEEVQAALSGEYDWLKVYVAVWLDQVVGLAVISDEDDWEYMACHYMVERFVDLSLLGAEDHAGLRVCLLSPVFQQRAGLFLRELHRLSGKTCLYYTLYPSLDLWHWGKEHHLQDDAEHHGAGRAAFPSSLHSAAPAASAAAAAQPLPPLSVPSVLDELMPVAPRPPPNGLHLVDPELLDALEEGEALGPADRREPPYALFLSTPKLMAMPKANVNVRIVVVGASDAALSFLETLVFTSPEVRYNNLTLVSRSGLPGEVECGALADRFFPRHGRYDSRQLARLQLGAWVNVVQGMVTKIHREERLVEVDGKTMLPYNYLFLFCGVQFCPPRLSPEEDLACKHYPTGKGWPAAIGTAEPGSARPVPVVAEDEPEGSPTGPEEEVADSSTEDTTMSISGAESSKNTVDANDDGKGQAEPDPPAVPEGPKELPINVFILNTDADLQAILTALWPAARAASNYTVVLYGWWHCPELLCCAAGLMHWGVPARNLLIVDPESPAEQGPRMPSSFGDDEVEAAVLAALQATGVGFCQGCQLQDWTYGEPDWLVQLQEEHDPRRGPLGIADGPYATHITLQPKQGASLKPVLELAKKDSDDRLDELDPLTIPCLALFCFQPKTIHPVTFSALVDSGLVMDGLLVIDRLGRTNDPFILAGGSITSYQRKLCAADMDHPYYNSLEIGRKMAERMRKMWDPLMKARAHLKERTAASTGAEGSRGSRGSGSRTLSLNTVQPLEEPRTRSEMAGEAVRAALGPYWRYSEMVPTLTAPVVLDCTLPGVDEEGQSGGLFFLRVRAPGPNTLLAGVGAEAGVGETRTFQTGTPGSGRFCRVQVDKAGFVRGIMCLDNQPLPVDMLVQAYGQHEDDLGDLSNLLEGLKSPDNMVAVYHRDPYKATQAQVDMDALFGYPSCKIVSAVTAALKSNNWEPLDAARRAELRMQWTESQVQISIENRVADLLRDHGYPVSTDEVQQAVHALLESKEAWK